MIYIKSFWENVANDEFAFCNMPGITKVLCVLCTNNPFGKMGYMMNSPFVIWPDHAGITVCRT